jgi:hypothetical protein
MNKRALVVAILLYVSSMAAFYVSNLRLKAAPVPADRPMTRWDYLGWVLFYLALGFTVAVGKPRKR